MNVATGRPLCNRECERKRSKPKTDDVRIHSKHEQYQEGKQKITLAIERKD